MKPAYLYVVPFFPSTQSWRGGFFYDAVKALMRDGRYDIKVMSTVTKEDYEIDGIHVYGVGSFKIGDSDYFPTITDFIKLHLFSKKLKIMGMSPENVAVCHVHLLERMAIYAQWMKKKNKNCFTLVHHHLTGEAIPRKSKLHWILPFENEIAYIRKQSSYKSVDIHLFCSQMAKEGFGKVCSAGFLNKPVDMRKYLKFAAFLPPLTCKSSEIFYNGVNISQFKPDHSKRDASVFKIGCVANFIETKDQITLIEAFAKACSCMPNAKVFFVGSGKRLNFCKQRVTELGLQEKIIFLPECQHSELVSFYQSLSLYVLPSYWEAFNCSLIEAHSCGVPVITTETISFKEVLSKEDQKKWLVPAKDADVLAEKILWVYKERPKAQQLTRNLDIDEVIREFLDWVDNFLTRMK